MREKIESINILRYLCLLFVIAFGFTTIVATGGGGGGSEGGTTSTSTGSAPTGSPDLQVENGIDSYDFGNVTVGNSIYLEVTVCNDGSEDLDISATTLSDDTNFSISNSYGVPPITVASGDCCTVRITFEPTMIGAHSATLTMTSNDSNSPHIVSLTGTGTPIANSTLNLNQIELDCPNVKAFVTVTDDDDFVYPGLDDPDDAYFTVREDGGAAETISDVIFAASVPLPISIAFALDYSGSVTANQDVVAAMEEGATSFIEDLGINDEAEIVKFDSIVEIVQSFTTNKTLLISAVTNTWNGGGNTQLYDAVYQAVTDTALRAITRRAIIVMTDGNDNDNAGSPYVSLTDVISHAQDNGIPIFTIGLGNYVNEAALQSMAEDTGGQYFNAPTADRLRTIYQQLIKILENQYVITYNSGSQGGVPATMTIELGNIAGVTGDDDTKDFDTCP